MSKFVIALDQGTTSSRALLIDAQGEVQGVAQQAFEQHFPEPGWVEHDPFDILGSQIGVLRELMETQGISAQDVAAWYYQPARNHGGMGRAHGPSFR